ncbi:ribokinase (plasmid) [Paracoccus liaowanqingii]|uniref:Ribokinase n=1 Tax=Paracoccus liaowanqingii TaxID=2560053 RepID=A0A4Y5SUB5_9RHOB|nr:PfkB family carbohydrate kinase [Paracoccus liaowanqingii]QDA36533.1 ribokinase [Paracoccus liaowanqingii]
MTPTPCAVTLGSLHYDIVVDAPHRPAAGETVTGSAWRPVFGGKGGNQAAAVVAAGVPCRMVSAVGDDAFGPFLRDGLRRAGVDDAHVATIPGTGSGMSMAIMDAGGDYGAVIVSGANLAIDPGVLAKDALWQDATHLVLQNEIPEALNLAAAEAARARGVTTVLNAAPARPMSDAMARAVDILVVNAGEAEALCGRKVASLEDAGIAARALAARFRVVVVTAGGDGVAVEGQDISHAEPGHAVALVSTHGAGDCFIGTMVAELVRRESLGDAVATANLAAARHVSQPR